MHMSFQLWKGVKIIYEKGKDENYLHDFSLSPQLAQLIKDRHLHVVSQFDSLLCMHV